MTGEGFFLDLAKIAITVVGFTGVVGSLRHQRDAPWSIQEVSGLRGMLEHSLGTVAFGLLPSFVSMFTPDERVLWCICSFALALFVAFVLLVQYRRIYHAARHGTKPRRLWLMLIEFFGIGGIAFVLQIGNVLSWRAAGAFGFGCAWLLFVSVRQFSVYLLHVREEHPLGE